jgi:hypothetical protein
MTVTELIDLFSELPGDTEVYVWLDGERLAIDSVDRVDVDYADINVRPE